MNLLPTLVTGLSLGCTYALVALGIVILYKGSGVLNLAHGSIAVLGAYVTARLAGTFGFFGAAIAGIIAAAGAAMLMERLLVGRMRHTPVVSLAIMTIGVEVLLQTELTRQIGIDILQLGQPWGTDSVELLDVVVPWNRLVTIAVAVVAMGVFVLTLRLSNWGVSMRAVAEDREASELVGLRLGTVAMVTWATAGGLAALAGILLTGAPAAGLSPALSLVVLRAFAAALIGGLDSVAGALVGGLIVGMVEAFVITFQSDLAFLGLGLSDVAAFLVMFVVLLLRPQGLFGRKEVARV
ncbi:branched-chain amino acid ABC transporter permease [Blastococcus sp. SYSU D00820]